MKFDLNARIARAKRGRRGLTLIELIVVLVILVGLGGLLVPVISNGLERTHLATCATSFADVTNMFARLVTTGGDIGDGFDSAVASDGTTGINGQNIEALSDGYLVSLSRIGVTQVFDHAAAADQTAANEYNVTFNPGYVAETLTAASELVTLTAAQEAQLNLELSGADDKYVFLGLGPNWSGMREEAYETPLHFGDTEGLLPQQTYSRFGAIVRIFQDTTTPADSDRGQFVGVSYSLDGTNYETGENHIALHWLEVVGE